MFKVVVAVFQDNKLPNPPAYIFMIDVSYMSVRSGLVNLLCTRLKEDILQHLPRYGDYYYYCYYYYDHS